MDISVIIVSYNSADVVLMTLASLRHAMVDGLEAEVIVVDNNSADKTPEQIRRHAPWAKVVEMGDNAGFAKANNVGMKMAKGDVILILNPDTIICRDTLCKIVDHFKRHENSGAIGVRMVNGRGRYLGESKRGYTNLATSFFKLSGLWHLAPKSKTLNAYYIGNVGEREICKAPILSGACMAFTREKYEKVGGFDEGYFMYSEDIDLSWRMDRASTNGNIYRGDIPIIHFKGQSTPRKRKYIESFYWSMQRFAEKYEFPRHGAVVNAITTIGIKVAFVFALVRCMVMRNIESGREFKKPDSVTVVAENDGGRFAENLGQGGMKVKTVGCSELEDIDTEAVVFVVSGDMERAIEYMRANEGKRLFGFCNDVTGDVLVFYNNRLHNIKS